MGYANPSQKGQGVHLRQFSRAFIFQDSAGERLVFVSIDTGMIGSGVRKEVGNDRTFHQTKSRYFGIFFLFFTGRNQFVEDCDPCWKADARLGFRTPPALEKFWNPGLAPARASRSHESPGVSLSDAKCARQRGSRPARIACTRQSRGAGNARGSTPSGCL